MGKTPMARKNKNAKKKTRGGTSEQKQIKTQTTNKE